MEIRARDITIAVGAQIPALGFDVIGLFPNDSLRANPTLTTTAVNTDQPGTFPITVTGGMVPNINNYEEGIRHVNGTLRIVRAHEPGWQLVGGYWYYFDDRGEMATGWLRWRENWFYLQSNGRMRTGWFRWEHNNQWYYLRSNGAMATGWQLVGGVWYYMRDSGAMATGWVRWGGHYYYLQASGAMATGVQTAGGVRHRFASDGRWLGRA